MNCVREMFRRKFGYESEDYPKFSDLVREDDLDAEVHCTGYGFTKEMENDLLQVNKNMNMIKNLVIITIFTLTFLKGIWYD